MHARRPALRRRNFCLRKHVRCPALNCGLQVVNLHMLVDRWPSLRPHAGLNRQLGLGDELFVLGDSVILTVLGQVSFLPLLVLAARSCPEVPLPPPPSTPRLWASPRAPMYHPAAPRHSSCVMLTPPGTCPIAVHPEASPLRR